MSGESADNEHMFKILHELGFDDLKDCEGIKLLKPWLDLIQPENIVTEEALEAYEDSEAAGLTLEDLVENIKERGLDLNYVDVTDEESIGFMKSELQSLQNPNVRTSNQIRNECHKMEDIVDKLRKKDKDASPNLKKVADSCLEIWEKICSQRQEICDDIEELVKEYFSDDSVDHFKVFLKAYEEKANELNQDTLDKVNKKLKDLREREEGSLETEKDDKTSTRKNEKEGKKIMKLRKRIELNLFKEINIAVEKGKNEEETGNSQNKICMRKYMQPEEADYKKKTLCACKKLAEQEVVLTTVIPENERACARKESWLRECQKVLDKLNKLTCLQTVVSVLLSMWNEEKRELYNVVKECLEVFQQDLTDTDKRIAGLHGANETFLAYIESEEFKQNYLPAQLWELAHKFNVPSYPENYSFQDIIESEEKKIEAVLEQQDKAMANRDKHIQKLEKSFAEISAIVSSQEKELETMFTGLETTNVLLQKERERQAEFKTLLQECEGLKEHRLHWVYALTNQEKLRELSELPAKEKQNEENVTQLEDWTLPLQSSTPITPPKEVEK